MEEISLIQNDYDNKIMFIVTRNNIILSVNYMSSSTFQETEIEIKIYIYIEIFLL